MPAEAPCCPPAGLAGETRPSRRSATRASLRAYAGLLLRAFAATHSDKSASGIDSTSGDRRGPPAMGGP